MSKRIPIKYKYNIESPNKINECKINMLKDVYEFKGTKYSTLINKDNITLNTAIKELKKYYQEGGNINDMTKIILKEKANIDIPMDELLKNDYYELFDRNKDIDKNELLKVNENNNFTVLEKIKLKNIDHHDKTDKLIINGEERKEYIFDKIYLDNSHKKQK